MVKDRPLLGISLMLGFCVIAPLADGVGKLLAFSVPMIVLVTSRFVLQTIILLPVLAVTKSPFPKGRRLLILTGLRGILHVGGTWLMVLALWFMPIADAIAIAFVMPFILLFIGRTFLGEQVGRRRLTAASIGFLGTLLVVQPSFAELGAVALLPLVVAVIFALFMVVTRMMAKEVDAVSMQALSGLFALTGLLPALWLSGATLESVPENALFLFLLGALGTISHLLMTWSLRFAPASTLAPMQYLEIPVAAVVGLVLFSDFPNGIALIGICITIGAGLYVVMREHSVSRQMPQSTHQDPNAA